jgi:hypothetical protein
MLYHRPRGCDPSTSTPALVFSPIIGHTPQQRRQPLQWRGDRPEDIACLHYWISGPRDPSAERVPGDRKSYSAHAVQGSGTPQRWYVLSETEMANMALACPRCNARRWAHIDGQDPRLGNGWHCSILGRSAGRSIFSGPRSACLKL